MSESPAGRSAKGSEFTFSAQYAANVPVVELLFGLYFTGAVWFAWDKEIWTSAACRLVNDREGRPVRLIGAMQNITERKVSEALLMQAKEEAEAANRAKGDFLSVMSHELRTPLNGVIGLGHVLADTELDGQQRECVETIVSCGRHLLTVISDILDFSKIDAGRMVVDRVPLVSNRSAPLS